MSGSSFPFVITGLDPVIQSFVALPTLPLFLDGRLKPGHDTCGRHRAKRIKGIKGIKGTECAQ